MQIIDVLNDQELKVWQTVECVIKMQTVCQQG